MAALMGALPFAEYVADHNGDDSDRFFKACTDGVHPAGADQDYHGAFSATSRVSERERAEKAADAGRLHK